MIVDKIIKKRENYLLKLGEPGETLTKFLVTDPFNRYLDIPHADKQPFEGSWIESNPICTDFYCKEEDINYYCNWFETLNCSFYEVDKVIISAPKYEITYDIKNIMKELFVNLVKNKDIFVSKDILFEFVELQDIFNPVASTCKTMKIPRWFDAVCDFKNVEKIIINEQKYDPEEFTIDHPLFLRTWDIITIESKFLGEFTGFKGLFFRWDLRKCLLQNDENHPNLDIF